MNAGEIFSSLGYQFNNIDLFQRAITHPSIYANNQSNLKNELNYEKLEFLGDAVIGMVAASFLIEHYPGEEEGILAKRKSYLVSGEILSKISKKIGLDEIIIISHGEEACGGRLNANNLENVLESIIGAIFLDGGIDKVYEFFKKHFMEYLESDNYLQKDPKSALQEWSQKNGKPIPLYSVKTNVGPAHSPVFEVEVYVDGEEKIVASGTSKKMAERLAAKLLLERIEKKYEKK